MCRYILILLFPFLLSACAMSTPEPTPTPTATPIPEPSPSPSPTLEGERAGWSLIWREEFNGTELNLENWTFDLGGHGWGNQELQVYTDRPENVRVEDGTLVIEARKENVSGRQYTSARIKTQGLHAWQYGRIEARIKLPFGQGIWPAFWMLGENLDQDGWPAAGEIDIMEFVGREPDRIYSTVHAPGYSGGNGIGSNINVPAESLRNEFHVYAVEWEENEIRWYFDDQQYFRLTPQDVPQAWVFDHPFFIILNLAVGGTWPGYPDATTEFPQFLYVDYVRVYQKP